jgi:formate dehydrogenase subunit gamma
MEQYSSGAPTVERLSLWQRWEHALMALSVLLLILSGTALAYHEQTWARVMIRLMGGLAARNLIHRLAAVVLLISCVLHLLGLLFSKSHQHDLREVIPRLRDFKEAWKGMMFALRGKGEKPNYGWFTPMQKLQYWGVLLGCLLMGFSGAMLWNPVATLNYFPKWLLDIMLVIHAKEAQLIFVVFILWHLYDVHIGAGNFPMNPAWITGRMAKDVFAKQHAAASEASRQEEA